MKVTYRIEGLDPAPFASLFAASDDALAAERAERVTATSNSGFPCRVSLKDAAEGDELILLHHVSNEVDRPFRMAHAIYVRPGAERATPVHDAVPAMLDKRTLGLRAFDCDGMMVDARLAQPGEADTKIRDLFDDPRAAYIHAHNAAYGCFLAAIERDK